MKMNNIYLPDGFPNTPDVKDLGGQYTAGDGIAIGSDGSISVDYGPGVTMTSTDKLTIDYGPGLTMTSVDKLTIKAGNGLEFSGADLAAKIGNGLVFDGDGSISNGNKMSIPVYDDFGTYANKVGDVYFTVYDDFVDVFIELPSITLASTVTMIDNLYFKPADYARIPTPKYPVYTSPSVTYLITGVAVATAIAADHIGSFFIASDGEYHQLSINNLTNAKYTYAIGFTRYSKEV